ncbi:MAG: phage/plasmid primase, P4 family [Bacteroidales bacterium]|jgi:P4 family phage/plasmid primase-like protien
MIPPQLQNPAFRFIRVAAKSKRPIDQDWQETANYQFDSSDLLQHLQDGGNYGIICGPGEVRVLDCDELARLEELGVLAKFPQTFAVQSRAGRVHRYYLIPELKKKIVLFDPILKDENGQLLHLGEIQGPGTQIVAPGSIHSVTGEPYKVIDDSPIAALSLEEVKAAIEGLKTSRVTEQILHRTETSPKEDDQFRNIRIDDIAYPKGETRRIGDEIQGTHPTHGSTTGKNFRIDLKKNTWYCDRCHSGGGPALWLAVESGILRCDQAASGALRGDDFRKVLRIAEDKGYIKKNLPYFKKLNRKAEPEKTKEITLLDVVDEHLFQAGPKKGQVEYTFNPDKAADAIINTYNLVATPDEKIWIYENGYYKDNGKVIIDKILDRVAGKLYTINVSKETQKKVFLRSMEEYDIFDQNPYLLCVRNGVIDLLTGDFLEHSPGYYLTSAASVEYDPSKRPTEFINFLEGACTNDDDRLTLIDWIVACACLTEFEYILFLTGHGSNGKHVYEALLQAFFGSDATEAISLEELMNSRFAMGYLRRARICISSETNPDKTKTELIKKISGNDWISSDVKNKDRARFKAYTQLIFDSNSMPIFEDTSYGFARRFTRVVMPYKFVDVRDEGDPLQKTADRHLLEKLTTDQELSGILNLIIIRAKEIALDRRIHRKDDSFERYEEQSYSVSDFMEKFIQFDPMMRDLPSWQESSDYLFKKFEEYATLTIGAKASRKKFSHVLGKENGESSRTVRPDDLDNLPVRGFRGLRFDEIEFNRFIEEKRDYFSKCNTCNDSVTICNDNNNDSSECNVTDVTIFRRILTALENGVSLPMGESSEMIVTRIVTTPDDSENEKFVTMLDSLQPQDLEVLQRSLNIMLRKRDPVTPFVLAIHCENLGTKIAPKVCANWLKADGWIENKPGWLKN